MKSNNAFRFKLAAILLLTANAYLPATAQMKHRQFVDEGKALSRKSEKNVVLINTGTLSDLMSKCTQMGIGEVKLVFTRLRPNDVNEYVANHPEARGFEQDLVGKMTVLIKIEADNISEADFVSDAQNNSLINKMSSIGLVKAARPHDDLMYKATSLYFEIGNICPPPASCN